jgi:hypothetical protein
MSQDHTHEPGPQPAVPSPWAEPGAAPSPFFAIPTPSTSGDIAPSYSRMPETTPQQSWPVSPQPTEPVTDQRAEQGSGQQSQAPQQRQAQERGLATPNPARLRRLCRRLRETHRCPGGGCVLSRARQDNKLGQFPDIR